MKIGIDVDDVLLDTLGTAWLPMFNELTHNDFKKDHVTQQDITKCVGEQYSDLIYRVLSMPQTWLKVKPVKYSQYHLKKLSEHPDIELYIVSATHPFTPVSKWKMFFKYFPFIDYKQLILAHDKHMLHLDLMVDDKPENLEVSDILFNQPHNKHFDDKSLNLFRAEDWQDVYDIILEKIQDEKEKKGILSL